MKRFDLQRRALHLTPACRIRKESGGTDLFGRLWWDRPACTIRTEFFKPGKGRCLYPAQHGPITHREAARVQAFPDDFRFRGSKMEIARQIGNAVPLGPIPGFAFSIGHPGAVLDAGGDPLLHLAVLCWYGGPGPGNEIPGMRRGAAPSPGGGNGLLRRECRAFRRIRPPARNGSFPAVDGWKKVESVRMAHKERGRGMKKLAAGLVVVFVLSIIPAVQALAAPDLLGTYTGQANASAKSGYVQTPATIKITSQKGGLFRGSMKLMNQSVPLYGFLASDREFRAVSEYVVVNGKFSSDYTKISFAVQCVRPEEMYAAKGSVSR